MRTYRLVLFSFVIILIAALIVTPVLSATTSSQALVPLSLTTQGGSTSGSLPTLGLLEQSNADDTPSTYITFATPSSLYSGYSTYQLPLDILPNKISSFLLQVNFKGPADSAQTWTWSVFNWQSQLWIKVGDTIGTQPNVWNNLTFRVRNFSSYVSSNGQIRIRLQSSNADADAKLDYQAIHITYTPVVPTPTRSVATSVPTKGVFVLPTTITPSPTLTPSITPSPTQTPSRTPTVTRTPTITNTPLPGFTWPQINLTTFKAGFSNPVFITNANDGTDRIFVVERCGTVRIIDGSGNLLPAPFINISSLLTCTGSEQGLLSIAFPPSYTTKKYFYASYTLSNGSLRVARFHVPDATPNQATSSNPDIIITIPHPTNTNHNGGQLNFGNDGYLYISTGDGGGGGDTSNNAQNKLSLLGKILRIDVEGGVVPYAVPTTNPFYSTSGYEDEIWAMGLRNPWRFSFDRLTHDLYIADVGQNAWEEVDFQAASSTGGDNFGWRCYEGNHAYNTAGCQSQGSYKSPTFEYSHSLGCSVTGGYVYRGSDYPSLQGIYLFGDYCSGRIWALKKDAGNWYNTLLLDTAHSISTFGEDEAGNIYLANLSNGTIYKVEVPAPGSAPTIAGCPLLPANNVWNTRVDSLPVHARSSQWISSIGSTDAFHMDFGSGIWPPSTGGPIGIPYNTVAGSSVTKYNVTFDFADESDEGPYPIPASPNMEFGSDHHILVVDTETCTLHETYDMSFSGGQWSGGSGATWSLNSNTLRPNTWTSADAAGLPILPGLVRYEEVAAGHINHAIRFTANATNSFIWPARHLTSGTEGVLTSTPPMGARFRLKSTYDISGFSPEMQVILLAMKQYGIILADNGSDWYISGAPSESWNNTMLHTLDVLTGSDFEAVDESSLMVDPNSGAVTMPTRWQPAVGNSWQWDLGTPVDTSYNVQVYDIDMFDNDASVVTTLHNQGKKVICYISVGSWENWRPDAAQFPAGVIGNDYPGWPGEKFLDIRKINTLAPILRARLDQCKQKGFDGIEPDNIENFNENTGFPLTYQDQLNFNLWLSAEAHARGLSIGLKNDADQVADLLPYFDWALTEDCYYDGWCTEMSPFITAGKPVLMAEYTDTGVTLNQFCPQAATLQFSPIFKNRDLDSFRQSCP